MLTFFFVILVSIFIFITLNESDKIESFFNADPQVLIEKGLPADTSEDFGRYRVSEEYDKVAFLDQYVKNLEWGTIAFYTPEKMKLAETKIIQLILSPIKSKEELQEELTIELSLFEDTTKIKVESEEIKITNEMEANISGIGFSVEPIEPELQAIINRTTKWSWNVTSTKKGKQLLHLKLSAYITINNNKKRFVVRIFNRYIQVDVFRGYRISKIFEFIENHWEWFFTAIIVPLLIFLRRFLRSRRER